MHIITEKSKLLNYDLNLNIKLTNYQKATLHKMLEFEAYQIRKVNYNVEKCGFPYDLHDKRSLQFNINENINNITLKSNIGVLANNVGSGKTLIIASLIKYKKKLNKINCEGSINNFLYNAYKNVPVDIINLISKYYNKETNSNLMTYSDTYLDKNLIFVPSFNYKKINTNLIIVPHNIFKQWSDELIKFNLKVKQFNRKNDFASFNIDDLNNYDVILCNANKLKQLDTYTDKYTWSRIFIDEVDTINIPNFPFLQSKFLWFVTATYERILMPKNKGFISDIFYGGWLYKNKQFSTELLKSLTIKCDQQYIKKYNNLPEPKSAILNCDTPFVNKILYYLESGLITNFINTNDYYNIKKLLLKREVNYTKLTFNMLLQSYTNYYNLPQNYSYYYSINSKKYDIIIIYILYIIYNIKRIKRRYNQISEQINSEQIRKEKINFVQKYTQYTNKLKYIKNEYFNNHYCLYCNERCSVNSIYGCIGCLNQNPHIQYIKNNFHLFDELDICEKIKRSVFNNFSYSYNKKKKKVESIKLKNSEHDKLVKLILNVKNDILSNKRILIFSDSVSFIEQVTYLMQKNNISNKILKGNVNTISKILKRLTNNEINVIILNMKYFGSGLNLQMVDSIYITNYIDKNTEIQVIGRANRYGRTKDLHVNYLFYKEEKNKYLT